MDQTQQNQNPNNEFARARAAFLQECCAGDEHLALLRDSARYSGLMCVHLNTRGDANVIVPGARPILKHVFLANPRFRNDIVEYYRSKGFGWVDIVAINRVDWKIFLSPPENRRAPSYVTPPPQFQFQFNQQHPPVQPPPPVANMV